ncbi:MAG: hypothetical protein WCF31_04820 [Candidatus Deferrimicrobiaceae bacterium]
MDWRGARFRLRGLFRRAIFVWEGRSTIPGRFSSGVTGIRLSVVPYLLLLFFAAMPPGCGGGSGTPSGPTRSAAMGFTYVPYDNTSEALTFVLNVIATEGDLLVAHHDSGIPWDAALANDFSRYPEDFRDEVAGIAAWKPPGHQLYLAVTPIAFLRNRLAPTRGSGGTQTFQPPWDVYPFDHPDVITAFTNHCRILIDRYRPDFFAFGIEVNLLRALVADDNVWNGYVALSAAVYGALKTSYPSLPMFQTVQAESFHADPAAQAAAIGQVLPYTDYIAVSSYPFSNPVRYPDGSQADPVPLPIDYFSALADLAPGKPFAIAETAWPAEEVTAPYPITIRSNTDYQKRYVEFLLSSAEVLSARFVNYFVIRDYDALWDKILIGDPNASLVRLWRDTGLYDGDGAPRPSLSSWRSVFSRPLRQ